VAEGTLTRPQVPLVVACAGSSPEARLAEAVSFELERRGVVARSSLRDVTAAADVSVRVAGPHRRVVAIDGCREGCASALLLERGIRAARVVSLRELADVETVDPADLVERIRALLQADADEGAHTGSTVDDAEDRPRDDHGRNRYLRALLEAHPARSQAAAVARALGVSRPSAGQALDGLRRRGLVERHADKSFALTASGMDAARTVVRSLRIAERFLVDFVGYPVADVRELAVPIADALTADATERLFERLGSPARCPHGNPIDPVPAPRLHSCRPATDVVVGRTTR
jgi:Mn-dependent DtxR family transcriptional regulator/uncharacterized metal-binding protein